MAMKIVILSMHYCNMHTYRALYNRALSSFFSFHAIIYANTGTYDFNKNKSYGAIRQRILKMISTFSKTLFPLRKNLQAL